MLSISKYPASIPSKHAPECERGHDPGLDEVVDAVRHHEPAGRIVQIR
jgi:hypothetical protein